MTAPKLTPAATTETVWAVVASYDTNTKRPKEDVAQMFKNIASSLGQELESARATCSQLEVELAETKASAVGLHNRINTMRRVRIVAGVLSIFGAILIAFGISFMTTDQLMPGLIILVFGVLMQLVSLGTAFVDHDHAPSTNLPQPLNPTRHTLNGNSLPIEED